jgi:hypothetical protein
METKGNEEDVCIIYQGKIGEGQNAEIREMPKEKKKIKYLGRKKKEKREHRRR